MNIARMIEILERSKRDHYSERSGLDSCPASDGLPAGRCDCNADEINGEIDDVIAELKKIGDALLAEPLNSELREVTQHGDTRRRYLRPAGNVEHA